MLRVGLGELYTEVIQSKINILLVSIYGILIDAFMTPGGHL